MERDNVILKIRRLMLRHSITIGDLKRDPKVSNVCERQAGLFISDDDRSYGPAGRPADAPWRS